MQVEMIPNPFKKEQGIKTELTHIKGCDGWRTFSQSQLPIQRVVYLGKCSEDGDTFAIFYNGMISFCKGHLNNGTLKTY
jgi:hypothetical protein